MLVFLLFCEIIGGGVEGRDGEVREPLGGFTAAGFASNGVWGIGRRLR